MARVSPYSRRGRGGNGGFRGGGGRRGSGRLPDGGHGGRRGGHRHARGVRIQKEKEDSRPNEGAASAGQPVPLELPSKEPFRRSASTAIAYTSQTELPGVRMEDDDEDKEQGKEDDKDGDHKDEKDQKEKKDEEEEEEEARASVEDGVAALESLKLVRTPRQKKGDEERRAKSNIKGKSWAEISSPSQGD
jgi:hypothetical protein